VDFARPFKRLDFIPAIEAAIGQRLPQLDSPDATAQVQALLGGLAVPLPSELTLPRLLDKLCGEYLEPQCESPTFIVNHPECLSPLSKSFVHPTTAGQRVAARAELFIGGREVVNLYEEENSPDEQRAKFQRQLDTRDSENASRSLDERFLECLEWGLPPTGGWGCGIERLTMLFTGARRIDDVLPFGNLRSGSPIPSLIRSGGIYLHILSHLDTRKMASPSPASEQPAAATPFPYSLTVSIPLPSYRLADAAKRAIEVDKELSSSVSRQMRLESAHARDGEASEPPALLITEYRATTNRMLRVAVNGFMESLGVVLGVVAELDADVLAADA
ncbi:hypothetical protein KEM52_000962, partial [Ascosphaera acerosa]